MLWSQRFFYYFSCSIAESGICERLLNVMLFQCPCWVFAICFHCNFSIHFYFPLAVCWQLFKRRKSLQSAINRQRYGFLCSHFRVNAEFWKFHELWRSYLLLECWYLWMKWQSVPLLEFWCVWWAWRSQLAPTPPNRPVFSWASKLFSDCIQIFICNFADTRTFLVLMEDQTSEFVMGIVLSFLDLLLVLGTIYGVFTTFRAYPAMKFYKEGFSKLSHEENIYFQPWCSGASKIHIRSGENCTQHYLRRHLTRNESIFYKSNRRIIQKRSGVIKYLRNRHLHQLWQTWSWVLPDHFHSVSLPSCGEAWVDSSCHKACVSFTAGNVSLSER